MNLIEILERYRVEHRKHGEHHHCSEGWVQVDCPSCSPNSGHFRLGFSLTSGAANCYVCGRQPAGSVLAALIDLPVRQAWAILGKAEQAPVAKKIRGKLKLPTFMGELENVHKNYLRKRKYDPDELSEMWKLKGTGKTSSHPWSIVIPITLNGKTVSFTTRQLHDHGIRYKSAGPSEEEFSHKELLFGEEHCDNAVIVVEGPMDVFRIGYGAVCTFGLTYTRSQLMRLSRYYRRVICFDNSNEAQKTANRLADELSIYPGETIRVELTAKDPGEAGDDEIKQLRRLLK